METPKQFRFIFTKRALDALSEYDATGSYPNDMTEEEFNLYLSEWRARYGTDDADRNQ